MNKIIVPVDHRTPLVDDRTEQVRHDGKCPSCNGPRSCRETGTGLGSGPSFDICGRCGHVFGGSNG